MDRYLVYWFLFKQACKAFYTSFFKKNEIKAPHCDDEFVQEKKAMSEIDNNTGEVITDAVVDDVTTTPAEEISATVDVEEQQLNHLLELFVIAVKDHAAVVKTGNSLRIELSGNTVNTVLNKIDAALGSLGK